MAAAAAHWGSFGSPGIGSGLSYRWWARHQASLAEARAALLADRFARAWADGVQLGLERAADLILA